MNLSVKTIRLLLSTRYHIDFNQNLNLLTLLGLLGFFAFLGLFMQMYFFEFKHV